MLAVAGGVAIVVAVGAIANRTVLTDRLLRADLGSGSGPFTTGATSGYNYDLVDGTCRIQSRIANPGPADSFANLARTAYAVDISADVVSVTGQAAFGVGCFNSPTGGYALLASHRRAWPWSGETWSRAPTTGSSPPTSSSPCRRPTCSSGCRVTTAWSGRRFR